MKHLSVGLLLLFMVLGFYGCNLQSAGSGNNTYSGTVVDWFTGNPVSGATVAFGSYSATSAADGTFSMNLGQQTGTLTGDYSVYATGYQFLYVNSVTLNAASNLKLTIPLLHTPTIFAAHTVSGKIYKSDGITEASTQTVTMVVLNASGGFYSSQFTYTSGSTGYSITTPTFGTDCLVEVQAPGDSFVVIVNKVDLSGSSTTLNLTEPSSTTSVTANGTSGNAYQLILSSPYGHVPGTWLTLLSASSVTATFTNPYNYQGYWTQVSQSLNTPTTGNQTISVSTSGPAPITSPVTLPSLLSTGPTQAPSASPLSYSNGTLSLASVTGANGYSFQPTGYGMILSNNSAAVNLPSWMKSMLSGKSIAVSVVPFYSSISFDLSVLGNLTAVNGSMFPQNFKLVQVQPTTGAYQTTITF